MTQDEQKKNRAAQVKEIYTGKVGTNYDSTMPPFFKKWKKKAICESSLESGDKVLVFCYGTGADFPFIINRIGENGKIVGVDFSPEMLKQAENRISERNWNNIELIEADVTKLENGKLGTFDAVVCTLGISIIPDHLSAYFNLISHVKPGGEVIIGDMQLASGFWASFNPITILMAKKYGGTHQGHQNSLEIRKLMKDQLSDVREKEFFFGAYFYCIGRSK